MARPPDGGGHGWRRKDDLPRESARKAFGPRAGRTTPPLTRESPDYADTSSATAYFAATFVLARRCVRELLGQTGDLVEHDEVGNVVDLLSKKRAGTQPLGLLGLVKVSKLGLLRPRLFPVFLVAALSRNDSEHDTTHLWRCRDAVFEVRAGFRVVLLLRGDGSSHRPRPRSGPGTCQGQPRFCQP